MNYGTLEHSETIHGVTYNVYAMVDEIEVCGNAMASGDDEADRQVEDEILARLENGDVWAWAAVTVEAEYEGLAAVDYLGCCCYADVADFVRPGGYYEDMKREALAGLIAKAKAGSRIYRKLSTLGTPAIS